MLATQNGVPVDPSVMTVTAVVIKSDGTNTTMTLIRQSNGLFKATLSLSKTATIRTYTILAKAHIAGLLDATSVATFEVRLPWLSTGGGQATITTASHSRNRRNTRSILEEGLHQETRRHTLPPYLEHS